MKIKISLTLFFLIVLSQTGNAQKTESDKIYWVALKEYCINLDWLHSKNPNIYKKRHEIFLQKPEFVDSIPPILNGYKITLITNFNQRQIYTTHSNQIIHTIMSPLTNKADKLYVNITPYHGSLVKNNYNLGLSDGTTIYFKFDSDSQKYIVNRVENWGI